VLPTLPHFRSRLNSKGDSSGDDSIGLKSHPSAKLIREFGIRNLVSSQQKRTEVLRRSEDVEETIEKFFTNERKRVDIVMAALSPNPSKRTAELTRAYLGVAEKGGEIRLLTEITKENIAYCKTLMKAAELRHMADISGNFVVSESEYLATPSTKEFSPSGPVLYSNEEAFVRHHEVLFEILWMNATPASQRVREIEEGLVPPKNELHYDPLQVQRLYAELVTRAKVEILLLLPTASAFHRDEEIGIVHLLRGAAERGVKVTVLGPIDEAIQKIFPTLEAEGPVDGARNPISYKPISESSSPNTATVLIIDRMASLIIEERDASKTNFLDAIGSATYTTSDPTVRANIHFFERVRDETELRVREERSRKDAELLQDILAHDMTNYNQVIKLNAEVLERKLGDEELRALIRAILHATDGSSGLIQRAKSLSRVMSQQKVELHEVDLKQSLERALSLVRESNAGRTVETPSRLPAAKVLADDLLDEVFVNILSNAILYTEGIKVPLNLRLEQEEGPHENGGKKNDYWKVTITDQGRGIPDERKELVSRRHLESAKGSGLGLSIVRALVVDRYSGRLELKNRIEGDYTKGTRVEIWLRKA
jgi:signal transduction histidine kinase